MTQENQGDQMTGNLCRWARHFSSVPLGISVSRATDQGCLERSLDGGTGPAEHPSPTPVCQDLSGWEHPCWFPSPTHLHQPPRSHSPPGRQV